MQLEFTLIGRCCDLALHPVSANTAQRIRESGRDIYKQKYLDWWRKGNTGTCGMKFDENTVVDVRLDGRKLPFASEPIAGAAQLLRRRAYLDSKARYLCLLGYDDELCSCTWRWDDVSGYDPARFDFFVHRWDRVLKARDFLIVDEVRYDGQFADEHSWGQSCGFTLVDPMVIDLDALRQEIAREPAMA